MFQSLDFGSDELLALWGSGINDLEIAERYGLSAIGVHGIESRSDWIAPLRVVAYFDPFLVSNGLLDELKYFVD